MHKVYYQPEGIWVGDIMPYGEDGTFYLYHQRDTRNPEPFGEPFGWALATTKDFVNYKDFGESLERGGDEEVDQYIYAGTVFKVGDKYHALYTGCNRDKVRARLMKQVLLHATSDDAVKWEKNIAETLLPPQRVTMTATGAIPLCFGMRRTKSTCSSSARVWARTSV